MATLDKLKILELNWCKNNIPKAYKHIHSPEVDFEIWPDARELGWTASDGVFPTRDKWVQDKNNHIIYLELKAIYMTIKHSLSVNVKRLSAYELRRTVPQPLHMSKIWVQIFMLNATF